MLILNNDRFIELKTLFVKNNVNLAEKDMALYANAFEIISEFINNKLTTEELFVVYDLLSDVINNRRPDIAVNIRKEDRIRIQVRLMEELKETKGKLNKEEKIALAFCIYTGECTQIYEEETGMIKNGIVLFDSFEHIKKELEYEKEHFPSKFNIRDSKAVFDKTYGYSVENPINTTSVASIYQYLKLLKYNGKPVLYERIGSFGNSYNEMIDGYNLYIEKKTLFKKTYEKVATLYFNAYCNEMPYVAPMGFSLYK